MIIIITETYLEYNEMIEETEIIFHSKLILNNRYIHLN